MQGLYEVCKGKLGFAEVCRGLLGSAGVYKCC